MIRNKKKIGITYKKLAKIFWLTKLTDKRNSSIPTRKVSPVSTTTLKATFSSFRFLLLPKYTLPNANQIPPGTYFAIWDDDIIQKAFLKLML